MSRRFRSRSPSPQNNNEYAKKRKFDQVPSSSSCRSIEEYTPPDEITDNIIRSHYIYGCQLLQDAGNQHKLPQIVVITGESIFHRFYFK
jgi:hypothetical protein